MAFSWQDSMSRTQVAEFAQVVMAKFNIRRELSAPLCSCVWGARYRYKRGLEKMRYRPIQPSPVDFYKSWQKTMGIWANADRGAQWRISGTFQDYTRHRVYLAAEIEVNAIGHPHYNPARRIKFDEFLNGVARAAEAEVLNRKRGKRRKRGKPKNLALHNAVAIIGDFWQIDLGRPFKPDFQPDLYDMSDPNQNKLHPHNEASNFCCDVLLGVCDQKLRAASIQNAMKTWCTTQTSEKK